MKNELLLRDYQKQCIEAINGLKKGSALVSMATGLGKTVIFSNLERKGKVLIISHREELVNQPIKYYDCPCGIEQGTNTSHGEEVVSASIQSLIKRLDKFRPDEFDLIITDEAHHAAAPSYKKAYAYFKPRLHIGFTATPNRGDKVRLDDVFEKIIFERDLKWGILNNWLSDIRCLRVKISCDFRKVKERMGDFMVNSLDETINTPSLNRKIAKVYQKYARGQTLIFATSVSHAENIAREIQGAVVVSQKTQDRAKIINDFTARKIPCIVNCMIFTEGTDIPLIETVIIARPTKNASLYTQMVGRGLRKAEGKPYLTLIDCVGITEDLEICTAPSLLGLDLENLPKRKLNNVVGMLTDMQSIIDREADCPENWITNVHAVELFARKQGVNTYSINWTKKPNGDLVYQFASGDRIGIKAINELGKTKVLYYTFDEQKQKFVYSESEEKSLQEALTEAYYYFETKHYDEKQFWNITSFFSWQNSPATEKQLSYIKSKLSEDDWENFCQKYPLTKGNASQIINMIKIRNSTPYDLLKMHKKALEAQKEQEKKQAELAKLKINKILVKGKRRIKYYAIRHSTELIITDDWEIAKQKIAELDGIDGKKCKYKSFTSMTKAQDFVRGKI